MFYCTSMIDKKSPLPNHIKMWHFQLLEICRPLPCLSPFSCMPAHQSIISHVNASFSSIDQIPNSQINILGKMVNKSMQFSFNK